MVFVIISILTALVLIPFSDFRNSQILDSEAKVVESFISEARSKTLASQNDNHFGVYFESDRVVLFAGDTYDELDPENKEWTLSEAVSLSVSGLSNDQVIFSRLTGKASQAGSVTVSLVSDVSQSKTVNISSAGILYIE